MGGKQKKQGFANKDIFQRINFLFQAVFAVVRENPENIALVKYYCQNIRTIAKKNVLRLSPDIKRSICKKCFCILIPGVTASVRLKSKRQTHSLITCLQCRCTKRFLTAEYQLWIEKSQCNSDEGCNH